MLDFQTEIRIALDVELFITDGGEAQYVRLPRLYCDGDDSKILKSGGTVAFVITHVVLLPKKTKND